MCLVEDRIEFVLWVMDEVLLSYGKLFILLMVFYLLIIFDLIDYKMLLILFLWINWVERGICVKFF